MIEVTIKSNFKFTDDPEDTLKGTTTFVSAFLLCCDHNIYNASCFLIIFLVIFIEITFILAMIFIN